MSKIVKKNETGLEVAVIGMSGRFPMSRNIEDFFKQLVDGKESIQTMSDEELLLEGISIDLLKDKNYIKAKGVIKDDDVFDSVFFGYTPKDAEIMDPQIRLFHECAWEALEDAGYVSENSRETIGLCASASLNMGWQQYVKDTYGEAEAAKPYCNRDFLTTLVAYKLNLKGPVFMINTACSSSLVAIHEACRSILTGECKMMLAGGVSLSSPQKQGYRYEEGMIMSSDGHLSPFSIDSKGAVGGSGIGVVLLKSLKNAVRDKDHIYAVIKSSAINNDGGVKVGFTAPSVEGQSKVIKKALKLAQVSSEDISYIETHGTGTKLGDPTEIEALKKAFDTTKRGYCALGAVKANIGHLDVASGIAGFIKTVMILNKRVIPPLINYVAPNEEISFLDSPFYTPLRKRIIEEKNELLLAGVSSFGIGGTNAHIILQEYREEESELQEDNTDKVIILSAKRKSILEEYCKSLSSCIKKKTSLQLKDIAYTLQVGRKPFEYRKLIFCNSKEDLMSGLLDDLAEGMFTEFQPNERKIQLILDSKVDKYEEYNQFLVQFKDYSNMLNQCQKVLNELGVIDVSKECKRFCFQYSVAKFLESLNIKIAYILASNGNEILAGCIASLFSLKDALQLVMMKEKLQNGKMLLEDAEKMITQVMNIRKRGICEVVLNGKVYKGDITDWLNILNSKDNHSSHITEKINTQMVCIHLNHNLLEIKQLKGIELKNKYLFMKAMGFLWLDGVNIQWENLYEKEDVHRVSITTYPFEKVKYQKIMTKGRNANIEWIDFIGRKLLNTEIKLYENSQVRSIRSNHKLYGLANQLCAQYVCDYFNENGIIMKPGNKFTIEEIKSNTKILNKYEKMLNSFIRILLEEKLLSVEENYYIVNKKVLSNRSTDVIRQQLIGKYPEYRGLVELLDYCSKNYTKALSEEEVALEVLYPEGISILQNEKYQVKHEHSYCKLYVELLISGVIERIQENCNGQPVKILEVGAGNGILTKELLPKLKGMNVEYYFTDIGKYFVEKAKQTFMEKYNFVEYKIFDISKDPEEQGIKRNEFDIVLGLNVVHATKDICVSLRNINSTLKYNGMLGLIESIHNERWYNMIDGLAEGWWYFEDENLRDEPLISLDTWRNCLETVGMQKIHIYPMEKEKQINSDMGLMIAQKGFLEKENFQTVEFINTEAQINDGLIEYQRYQLTNDYVEPITDLEKEIITILKELFGLEKIGIMDNFFEMGMDSIIAIRISAMIRKLGYKVQIADILKHPTVSGLLNFIESVEEQEDNNENKDIISFVSSQDMAEIEKIVQENMNIEQIYPLTPMQNSLLGQNTISYKSGLDVFVMNFCLEGKLNVDCFIEAWNLILKRHTILRTAFVWKRLSEPVQIVYKDLSMKFKYEDLMEYEEAQQIQYIEQYLIEERKLGFKGSIAPLTRGYIAKVANEKYKFIWTFQHSLVDGWSMNNIINDLLYFYNKLNMGEEIVVEVKPFFNYINWIKHQDFSQAELFWKEEFHDFKQGKELRKKMETVNQYEMDEIHILLSKLEKDKINQFSIEKNLTINTIIQTAWAIVMKKLTNEMDIILGFETSGRTANVEGLLSMAGLFISVLPYRAKLDEECTCLEWMKKLMDRQLNKNNHEYVTMRDISRWTNIPMQLFQEAIYDRTIVYQNFPNGLKDVERDFKLSVEEKSAQLNVQLRLYVLPGEELEVLIYFNKNKYQKEVMAQLLQDFKETIFNIMKNEELKMSDILNIK